MVSSTVLQVSGMSVQDPFVLDHNTTSNVNERMRGDVTHQFQRVSIKCHRLFGCNNGVGAEHAGIVELLSDSTSSVTSLASSPQLVLSPQQTADENTVGVDVREELAHMQMFVLKLPESANSASAVALYPWHRVSELEHSVGEPDDGVRTVLWHNNVTDVLKMMLTDIFDVDCVFRDQPSAQFDSQLNQLLTTKVNHHNSSAVLSRQQARNVASNSQPHSDGSLNDCEVSDSPLHPCHGRLPLVDACDIDDDVDTNDNNPRLYHSGCTAAKRHKPDHNVSNSDVISSLASSSRHLNDERHILLSVACSARSRLWVGRKKVRHQFLHFSDELKIQLEVSSAMRSKIAASDRPVIEFELAIIRHQQQSANELIIAVLPSKQTSKEFGCFIIYFISLLKKLVSTVTVEGPIVL